MSILSRPVPSHSVRAFSLVEVVIALGLFAFAIVVILGLFSTVNSNSRALLDSDALLSAWPALDREISRIPRSTIEELPSGEDSPHEIYLLLLHPDGESSPGKGLEAKVFDSYPPDADRAKAPDGRVYRASLRRALPPDGSTWSWDAGRGYYPLRVELDILPAGPSAPAPPLQRIHLHTVWNA